MTGRYEHYECQDCTFWDPEHNRQQDRLVDDEIAGLTIAWTAAPENRYQKEGWVEMVLCSMHAMRSRLGRVPDIGETVQVDLAGHPRDRQPARIEATMTNPKAADHRELVMVAVRYPDGGVDRLRLDDVRRVEESVQV